MRRRWDSESLTCLIFDLCFNIKWTKDMWAMWLTDRQTNITKTKHFRWWNVFDDIVMCRMGCWSFFDVNPSTFDENMCEKRFLHFRSQWPWSLTFDLRIRIYTAIVRGTSQVGALRKRREIGLYGYYGEPIRSHHRATWGPHLQPHNHPFPQTEGSQPLVKTCIANCGQTVPDTNTMVVCLTAFGNISPPYPTVPSSDD